MFHKTWLEKGVIFIHDLTNENGFWMNWGEFSLRYCIKDCYLKYMGLIDCLQKMGRNHSNTLRDIEPDRPIINFDHCVFPTFSGSSIDISKSKSRTYYNELIKQFEVPVAQKRWLEEINITI